MEKISLVIENDEVKKVYFDALKKEVGIPVCLNCGLLFSLGFPNNEDGICDRLICEENYLICECEYAKMVRNIYNIKEDGLIDISPYYKKEE